jgi:hypothetical protein
MPGMKVDVLVIANSASRVLDLSITSSDVHAAIRQVLDEDD